jgi:hypothetical protein
MSAKSPICKKSPHHTRKIAAGASAQLNNDAFQLEARIGILYADVA